jgi:hypothetical protein
MLVKRTLHVDLEGRLREPAKRLELAQTCCTTVTSQPNADLIARHFAFRSLAPSLPIVDP